MILCIVFQVREVIFLLYSLSNFAIKLVVFELFISSTEASSGLLSLKVVAFSGLPAPYDEALALLVANLIIAGARVKAKTVFAQMDQEHQGTII